MPELGTKFKGRAGSLSAHPEHGSFIVVYNKPDVLIILLSRDDAWEYYCNDVEVVITEIVEDSYEIPYGSFPLVRGTVRKV